MADNHIDFKYSSYVQDIWLWVWSFPLGLCFRKTGGFTKTDTIACQVLEEMAKTAPIEIQQQMQDNIQWIKGALVVHKREFFMPMQKAV
jgi:urocanate hydratase